MQPNYQIGFIYNGVPENVECECHSQAIYSRYDMQNPTCTTEGSVIVYYQCFSCGVKPYRLYTVPKIEHLYPSEFNSCAEQCIYCGKPRFSSHNYQYKETVRPTCTTEGYDLYKCSRCKATYKDNVKDALGHNYVYTTIPPTCTTKGYIAKKCQNCQEETIINYTMDSTLGHDYQYEIDKYPTCTTPGSKSKYCQREGCHAKLEGSTVSIPATGHNYNYNKTVTAPTCQTKGYTTYTCSCGASYKDNYTDIVDHSYVFKREQELTCIWNHFKYYECKWCNKGKYENIELTTGHKWEGTTCSVCGEKMQVIAGPWNISANDGTSSVTASLCDGSSNTGTRYALIISGTGNMKNFSTTEEVPWKDYRNNITYVCIEDGVTNIGDFTFASHTTLIAISIPTGVTSIGKSAFLNCEKIEYIDIPYSVTSIGEGGFALCKNLKTVSLSGNVTEIAIGTFKDCTALQNINLPTGLKSIKLQAFYNCSNLQKITIPKTIEEIGTNAFYNVNKTVYYYLISTNVLGTYVNQSNFIAKDKIYIYEQPINCVVDIDDKASFYCMAGALSEITYQWYKITGTTVTKIEGATNYSYQTNELEASDFGASYYCEVTEAGGNSVKSDLVKAIKNSSYVEVTITKQPENAEIARGERATFEIKGHGEQEDVDYTWYYNEGSGAFQEITRDIGTIYTTEDGGSALDTVAYDNERYWNRNYLCIVSNRGGTVTSNIVSAIESETKELVDIRILEGQTEYVEGQKIDKSKLTVKAIYNDGTTTSVTNYSLSNENALTTADSGEIKISWLGNTATMNITVVERQISKIEMQEEPSKTLYEYGESFDSTGMVITAIYNDDSIEEITDYQINNKDNLTCINNTVEIVYGDFKIPFSVLVSCDFQEVETVAPACLDEGYTEYECSVCGKTEVKDYTEALGHSFTSYVSNNDATCESDGTKTATCDRCEATDTIQDESTALGHEWQEDFTVDYEPICTETGSKSKHCSRCNATTDSADIPALGHDWATEFTVDEEATCEEEGIKSKHCTRCDAHTEVTSIESLGHDFTNYTSNNDATCTVDGTKTGICSRCGKENTTLDEGSALGHNWNEEVIDKEPTCEEKGIKSKHCTRCDMITEVELIEALGHSFTNYVSNNDATCANDGTKTAKCDRCEATETITDEGSKKLHTEVIDKAVEPTCTETGLTEGKHCSICNAIIKAQTTVPAKGHTEVIDKAVAPTCTETGLTEGKHCSVCNEVIVAQEVEPALGHSFTNYVSNNDATCTKDGTKIAKCDRCEETDTKSDEGSKKPHTEVIDEAVAPTCTETGLTEGKHCSVCNEVIIAQETVPAKGHTEVIDKAVEATCTETGLTEGKHCSVCNIVIKAQTTVPALGHSYENGECIRCGEEEPEVKVTSEKYSISSNKIARSKTRNNNKITKIRYRNKCK